MKGLICYYSGTGNTKLACDYIIQKAKTMNFDYFNVAKGEKMPDFTQYQIVGFATFTDWWGVPFLFEKFIESIQNGEGKYAFVFNTFAQLSGKTLVRLKEIVENKGFNVINGFSLRTPENYPPSIAKGMRFEDYPRDKDIKKFNNFIIDFSKTIDMIAKGEKIKKRPIRIGIFNMFLPIYSRTKSKEVMGKKYVDVSLCTECGICKSSCPYKAIGLNNKPFFNEEKCYGCWSCFNHCQQKAIYTEYVRGKGHYPEPLKKFREKLTL